MPSKQLPVSLSMIVKNEEKFIESAIKSAKKIMGIRDIVVVDTGSEDATKQLAAKCGARVFDFEWIDDFSAARNFAASQAENDWLFMLDADEEITEADISEVRGVIKNELNMGVAMMIELSDNTIHETQKLYNRKTFYYNGTIHENLKAFDDLQTTRVRIPVIVKHSGYIEELQEERGKFQRNVTMLEAALAKDPNNPYYLYHLGKSYFNFDKDLQKACECFEKVLTIEDDITLGYIYTTVECYGYALINTGKFQEALNLVEVYFPYYKVKPEFRFLTAHIYQNNAMFIEAVECYESCIGADMFDTKGITSYLSYYNIGVILECIEMFDDAIMMYRQCGDYAPALERLEELSKR